MPILKSFGRTVTVLGRKNTRESCLDTRFGKIINLNVIISQSKYVGNNFSKSKFLDILEKVHVCENSYSRNIDKIVVKMCEILRKFRTIEILLGKISAFSINENDKDLYSLVPSTIPKKTAWNVLVVKKIY